MALTLALASVLAVVFVRLHAAGLPPDRSAVDRPLAADGRPTERAAAAASTPTREPTASVGARARADPTHDPRWSEVLDGLSAARARAWRRGAPGLLRAVYVPGSVALRRDQQMLDAYRRRGLRVRGVVMDFSVVLAQRQRPGAASLLVVDALGPAVAQDGSGHSRLLPRDLPTRHRIELAMTPAGWRIRAIALGWAS